MLALLILPILVSGFIVLTINPKEKLKLHRYDGQLLYLKASKIGLKYFFIVTFFSFLLKDASFKFESSNIDKIAISDASSALNSKANNINPIVPLPNDANVHQKFKNESFTLSSDKSIIDSIDRVELFTTQTKKVYTIDLSVVSYVAKEISRAKGENKVSRETLEQSWLLSLSFLTVILAYLTSKIISFYSLVKVKVSKKLYKNDVVSMKMLGDILKDSPIDYIFYESLCKQKPILISMKNRKIYVGFVNKLGEPSESNAPNQEISLVPAISGYRDKDTLEVTLKNEYNTPDEYDASLVIKVDQIESVSWFSQEVYDGVNGNIGKKSSKLRRPPKAGTPLISIKQIKEWWAKWWA
ncbi:hypothetical protein [Shewanella xiamenensis]|uniref:hypothetical protein n=1 Tax=Shewanella xiamenensis TaxID=332186 RepID=UPI00313D5CA8